MQVLPIKAILMKMMPNVDVLVGNGTETTTFAETEGGEEKDEELKIGGVRIDCEEVISVLQEHPAVDDALVTACDGPFGKALAAYVVVASGARPSDLTQFVAREVEKVEEEDSVENVSKWSAVYDEMYMEQANSISEQDPTLNLSGYIDTYSGKSHTAPVIKEWVEWSCEQVTSQRLLFDANRDAGRENCVLEIGCGKGMLLFRLAPLTGDSTQGRPWHPREVCEGNPGMSLHLRRGVHRACASRVRCTCTCRRVHGACASGFAKGRKRRMRSLPLSRRVRACHAQWRMRASFAQGADPAIVRGRMPQSTIALLKEKHVDTNETGEVHEGGFLSGLVQGAYSCAAGAYAASGVHRACGSRVCCITRRRVHGARASEKLFNEHFKQSATTSRLLFAMWPVEYVTP